jgi:uncharacterized membrane protein HdeD (DUF308 family)
MSALEQDLPDPAFPLLPAHRYWLQLFIGVVALGVGVAAFAWPEATVQVIGFLFGLNLLLTGFIRAAMLLFAPGYSLLYRIIGIVFSVLVGILGILCLRNITGSVRLLLLIVALGWLLDGLVELCLAAARRGQPGNGARVALGLVAALGAVALLVWPKLGLGAFILIGATILVFVGIGHLISAIAGLRADRAYQRSVAAG